MKIAAFDLGTNMAVAWRSEPGARPRWKGRVLIGETRAEKLAHCERWLCMWWLLVARDLNIEAIFYERPFARGQAATRMLWGIAGHLEAFAAARDLPVVDMPPSTIKKHVTGDGAASKALMLEAARRFGYDGNNEHEADAICALVYAEHHIEKDLHHAKAK